MKRTLKIGLVILVTGLVLMAIGAMTHSFKSVTFNDQHQPELVHVKTFDRKVKSFKVLDVNLKSNQLRIKEGDSYRVQVRSNAKAMPRVTVKNQRLVIEQTKHDNSTSGWHFGSDGNDMIGYSFSGGRSQLPDRTVVVTVPRGTKLDQIKLVNRDGDLRLTDIQTNKLTIRTDSNVSLEHATVGEGMRLSTGDGNIYLQQMNLTNPQLTTDDGDVALKDVWLNQATVQLTDGDFRMRNGGITGIVNVNNQDGDNTVVGADRGKGYILHGADNNRLFDQHREDGGLLQQNETNNDRLQLTTNDGDNSVQ